VYVLAWVCGWLGCVLQASCRLLCMKCCLYYAIQGWLMAVMRHPHSRLVDCCDASSNMYLQDQAVLLCWRLPGRASSAVCAQASCKACVLQDVFAHAAGCGGGVCICLRSVFV
jgi:hypothetical protein